MAYNERGKAPLWREVILLRGSAWLGLTALNRMTSSRIPLSQPGMGFFSDWIPSSTFLMGTPLGVRWIFSRRKIVAKTVDGKITGGIERNVVLNKGKTKISIVVIWGVIFSPRILFACLRETWDRDTYIRREFLKLRRIRGYTRCSTSFVKYLNSEF